MFAACLMRGKALEEAVCQKAQDHADQMEAVSRSHSTNPDKAVPPP